MARKPQPTVDEQLRGLDELPGERATKIEALKGALERATTASRR